MIWSYIKKNFIMRLLGIAVVSLFSLSLNAEAGNVSDYCAAKWARSESMGGSYGEAMMGVRDTAPDCYCQADINKVKTMGAEMTASYLNQCKQS